MMMMMMMPRRLAFMASLPTGIRTVTATVNEQIISTPSPGWAGLVLAQQQQPVATVRAAAATVNSVALPRALLQPSNERTTRAFHTSTFADTRMSSSSDVSVFRLTFRHAGLQHGRQFRRDDNLVDGSLMNPWIVVRARAGMAVTVGGEATLAIRSVNTQTQVQRRRRRKGNQNKPKLAAARAKWNKPSDENASQPLEEEGKPDSTYLAQYGSKALKDVENLMNNVKQLEADLALMISTGSGEDAEEGEGTAVQNESKPKNFGASKYHKIIRIYARLGMMDRADFWLSQLLASNIDLSLATVKTLILACSDMDAPDLDRIDYYSNLLIESKINMDSSCYRNILTACCKEGDTGRAQFWFNRLVQSNIQPSHDAIVLVVRANLHEHSYNKDLSVDTEFVDSWIENEKSPSSKAILISRILKGCHEYGNLEFAKRCINNYGIEIDDGVHRRMFGIACKARKPEKAEEWLVKMRRAGMKYPHGCYSSLIEAFRHNGDIESAEYWKRRSKRAIN